MATVDLRPQTVDVYCVAGDTLQFALGFVDSAGSALDLNTYTVTAQARRYPAAGSAVDFTVSEGAGGTATFSIAGSVTSGMVGSWRWDCEVVSNAGVIRTPAAGLIDVLRDVDR